MAAPTPTREPNYQAAAFGPWPIGVPAILEYNGIIFNDRRAADVIRITKITGLDDPEVRDTREENPDRDGETPFDSLYGGRTMTFTGEIKAGNMARRDYLWDYFKTAFDDLVESPLYFRWLDWRDFFTQSLSLNDYIYDAGAGQLSIASDGSGIAPSNTNVKELILNSSSYYDKYNYADCEAIVEVNHATMAGVLVGPQFRRKANGDKLRVIYDHANTRLALYKVVGGVATLLDNSAAVTLVAGTNYWISARIENYVVTYSVWSTFPPDVGGTPWATKSFTLSGGDQAIFPGAGVNYRSGLYWTPNSVADRVKLLDVGALNPGDAIINCRKLAKIEYDDVQEDQFFRRKFMLTMRASDPRFVSRKITTFSAVPGSFAIIFPGGGGGVTFPADGSGLFFGAALGTATNLGRSPASPIVRMVGQIANPVLMNSRNGRRIGVNATIADGDYYDFDCYNRTVVDSLGTSHYDVITSDTDWIQLERGANAMVLGADSVGVNGVIKMFMRHSSR